MESDQWKFSQCFGEKSETIDVAEGMFKYYNITVIIHPSADIISTVNFDRTGDFLASGDRAGRVVLFQRNHTVYCRWVLEESCSLSFI